LSESLADDDSEVNLVVFTRNFERLVNVFLFLIFGWGSWLALQERLEAGITVVEASFIAQNMVFCAVLLARSSRREMSTSIVGQLLAIAAFFSGMGFLKLSTEAQGSAAAVGQALIVAANLLAVVSLATLGRSFGILIARRKLKTSGVYGLVRHPMYLSDLTLRLGYVLLHPGLAVVILLLISIVLYGGRASWEEKFLRTNPDYVAYAQKVRWRFIPWIY
jgi:protein-S-isoprenylcysteine O-methyltransferase Ste14